MAERIPRRSWSARLLAWMVGGLLLRAPRTVVAVCLVAAAGAAWLTAERLEIKSSRLDLLNPNSEFNQRWLAYLEEFGEDDDAVVVVEGGGRSAVIAAIESLGMQLEQHSDLFPSVLYHVDTQALQRKGLYLLSDAQLAETSQFVRQSISAITAGPEALQPSQLVLGSARLLSAAGQTGRNTESDTEAEFQQTRDSKASVGQAERQATSVLDSLTLALQSPPVFRYPSGLMGSERSPLPASGYLLADDGRLGFILVSLPRPTGSIGQTDERLTVLRRLVAKADAENGQVAIGLTGLPILEQDEMQTSQADMSQATILSLVGVAALFVVGFGQLRLPLCAVGCLMIALVWTLGYTVLSVGHLNILSISFGAILIGLGIDFGIHLIARYMDVRQTTSSAADAITRSVADTGPGIVTGAVTTALAFFAAAMTSFTGIAELGVISAGGVMLCLVAAFVALPPMMLLSERRRPVTQCALPIPVAAACAPAVQTPRFTIVMVLCTTAVLAVGLPRLQFDHNLLNLQSKDLPSVAWERRLLARGDQSVWFAVSMARSPQELLARKAALERLPSVARTEQLASLVTADTPARRAAIAQIAHDLERLPRATSGTSVVPANYVATDLSATPQLPALLGAIEVVAMTTGKLTELSSYPQALRRLQETLQNTQPSVIEQRLRQFQSAFAMETASRLQQLKSLAVAAPPSVADIPAAWRSRFVGHTGQYALRIFGRGDIWSMEKLQQFVREVESVDPRVTGHPIQTYYASRQMQQSYLHGAIYAALAVMIVLMLDFQSVRLSGLALLPLMLGMVQLLGLMALLDIPLNAANMIVLPLILGIGIDDGVHVVHDFLHRTPQERVNYQLGNATATAVVLTSATTMLGFGSMMVAQHQGLRSLGQVLTLGVFCCLFNSLLLLPAVLACEGRKASSRIGSVLPLPSPAPPHLLSAERN